jgi:predicted outer membrane repeat protein
MYFSRAARTLCGLVFGALAMAATARAQHVWYVNDDANGAETGANWPDAFTELQSALTVAQAGDQVWVASGVYRPDFDVSTGLHSNNRFATFELHDGVALYGGFAGVEVFLEYRAGLFDQTILSGEIGAAGNLADNNYHIVTGSGTDASAILDGFTINSGRANGLTPDDRGAGMYNDGGSPTVIHCHFSYNRAEASGGGVFNTNGGLPSFTECTFSNNMALEGGGMYNNASHPTVSGCTFRGNTAFTFHGGGMYNSNSSPKVNCCTFIANFAHDDGGGMFNLGGGPTITDCTFIENVVNAWGGAVYNNSATSKVINCVFSGNSAGRGGAIYHTNDSASTVTNCTLSGNRAPWGGGMYNSGSQPKLTNCILSGNAAIFGGGIYNDQSTSTLANCILWGNSASNGPQISNTGGSTTIVSYGSVQGGWNGIGNINSDPLWVRNPSDGGDGWGDSPATPNIDEAANDDYGDLRLRAGSPCIDAADNRALPADGTDLDGDGDLGEPIPIDRDFHPRFANDLATTDTGRSSQAVPDRIVDMGALEFWTSGDFNGDGHANLPDLVVLLACLGGPDGNVAPACRMTDLDPNGDTDLGDFGVFQGSFGDGN